VLNLSKCQCHAPQTDSAGESVRVVLDFQFPGILYRISKDSVLITNCTLSPPLVSCFKRMSTSSKWKWKLSPYFSRLELQLLKLKYFALL